MVSLTEIVQLAKDFPEDIGISTALEQVYSDAVFISVGLRFPSTGTSSSVPGIAPRTEAFRRSRRLSARSRDVARYFAAKGSDALRREAYGADLPERKKSDGH